MIERPPRHTPLAEGVADLGEPTNDGKVGADLRLALGGVGVAPVGLEHRLQPRGTRWVLLQDVEEVRGGLVLDEFRGQEGRERGDTA
jgi:hypothetical protein